LRASAKLKKREEAGNDDIEWLQTEMLRALYRDPPKGAQASRALFEPGRKHHTFNSEFASDTNFACVKNHDRNAGGDGTLARDMNSIDL
jgi:hypothetical protein